MSTNPKIRRTELLNEANIRDATKARDDQLVYLPVPSDEAAGSSAAPVWRVRFEMVEDTTRRFGLDINGEIKFGRGAGMNGVIDLTPYDAETQGVSREHLLLRPSINNLFLMDLGSTNGTLRNGRSIGIKTPYALVDGDIITLGRLQFHIHIVERPNLHTRPLLNRETSLAEALSQIAQGITSQLELDEVLNQVASTAMSLTAAGEATIWLIDQNTGEMFLEAKRSLSGNTQHLHDPQMAYDPLITKVIRTGKPIRAQKHATPDETRLATGYMMEAVAHIPIMLGGIAFGVVTVGHREPGKQFDDRDLQLLTAIADFAAIAIQNARLFQATDQELQRRLRELSALNEVSRSVSASLDIEQVFEVLIDEVNKYCPVAAVRLYLRDQGPSHLRLLAEGEERTLYPLGRGIVSTAVRTAKPIVSNEIAEHPDYDNELDGLDGRFATSMVVIPLKVAGRVVGVLALVDKTKGEFTEDDVALLSTFANPVATAIENASLFLESVRQRRAIQATAETLTQPLMLIDDMGNLLVANETATELLSTNMSQLFEAISSGVGRTTEVAIGDKTFLSTTEHLADVGTINVMQDITYVKMLEKDRSEFLHMLSHDLKNPLMAITGWSSLIERTANLDEKGRKFVEEIHIAADRMLKMINQLLTTVDQDTSVQLVREPCDLAGLGQQIIEDVQGAALNKSIRLSFDLSGEPYQISGDETRLYHMILNLMDNAIKYSPKETAVDLYMQFSDTAITIKVKDEGPGIPEADLKRIFNKYYRSSQTGGESGSGLGLAAVKGIVEAHGGKVRARNRSAAGTAFEISLPASLRLP